MKLSKYSSLSLVLCGFSLFLLSLLTNCSSSDPAPPPPATPVAVVPQVIAVSTTGFTLSFDVAVPELTVADIIIANKVTSVTAADASNKIYTVVTSAVAAGSSFTVSLKKEGYTFAPATLTFSVPKPDDILVKVTETKPTATGFTLGFDKAVTSFAKEDITIDNGASITSATAVGTDSKLFTVVTSALTVGSTYHITLAKTGYSFSPNPVVYVVVAMGNPTITAFSITDASGTAQAATIDQTAKTISYASAMSLCSTSLVPTITVGAGYTVEPATAQDFSKDVTYTVKDAAGTVVNTYTAKAITATLPKLTLGTSTAAVSHRYVVFYYRLTDVSGGTAAFSGCTAKYNFVVLPTATAAPANAAAIAAYKGALTLNAKGSEERAAMLFLPGAASFDANGTPNATLEASTAYTLYAAAEGTTIAPTSLTVKTGAVMMDSPFRITRNSTPVTKIYCSNQYGYIAASGISTRAEPIALYTSLSNNSGVMYVGSTISAYYNLAITKFGVSDLSHTDEGFLIRKTLGAAGTNTSAPNPFDFGNLDFNSVENDGFGPIIWMLHYTDISGDDRYMENGNKYQTSVTGKFPTTPAVE